MTWLVYALITVAGWTFWSFFGKLALKTTTPYQAGLVYGIAVVGACAALVFFGQRSTSWSPSGLWIAALSGGCGAVGLVAFYLSLERGKASLVTAVVGVYPAIVALLSVLFLSERLTVSQVAGVVLALVGVTLVGAGS
jgi:transporter family protein